MATKYTFDAFDSAPVTSKKKYQHHRRQASNNSEKSDDNDPTDGGGSLSYSATSSINSATGESTDSSSLAGILRVLDVQDSKELAAVLERERIKKHATDRSIATESQNSLAYSTDAESNMRSLATEQSGLLGTGLLGTLPGSQTSDLYDSDELQYRTRVDKDPGDVPASDTDDLIFSPAEHTDSLKRRKDKKRREKKLPDNETPRVKNSKTKALPGTSENNNNNNNNNPLQRPNAGADPAKFPKGKGDEVFEMEEEEDVWYAKWWMFCFPDAVKTSTGNH